MSPVWRARDASLMPRGTLRGHRELLYWSSPWTAKGDEPGIVDPVGPLVSAASVCAVGDAPLCPGVSPQCLQYSSSRASVHGRMQLWLPESHWNCHPGFSFSPSALKQLQIKQTEVTILKRYSRKQKLKFRTPFPCSPKVLNKTCLLTLLLQSACAWPHSHGEYGWPRLREMRWEWLSCMKLSIWQWHWTLSPPSTGGGDFSRSLTSERNKGTDNTVAAGVPKPPEPVCC